MNFLLRNIFFIFAILFLGIDIFFVFSNDFLTEKYIPYVFVIAILEVSILSSLAYYSSIKPIRSLKKEIALFLTGAHQGGNLAVENLNPDVRFVTNFFNKSLEILKNFKEEFKAGRILKSEVEFASEIQRHVLKKRTVVIPSIDIVADTKSATEVGGDSYDIIEQGDNYYIYIGDVTGHGVASGFVMMIVNALISGFSKIIESSAEILAKTNEIVKPRVKSNILMTLLMIRWNEKEKKMYMTGAGHEYLIVYKASKNKAFKIKSGGVALGMTKNISKILKETQIAVEKDDIVVLYTDGITEARNGKNESDMMLGIDRLVEIIETTPIKTAQGIFNNITIELSKFMGYGHKQFDDITLISMHYRGDKIIENDVSPDISTEFITEWNWQG
ncbi:MAG: SpoIIE family protein phosphatase [Candidatus Gracilibacteria bacterium]|nr:SpoIIE family protein phosphatase [Candidatus Gracilibacteria bacterium]